MTFYIHLPWKTYNTFKRRHRVPWYEDTLYCTKVFSVSSWWALLCKTVTYTICDYGNISKIYLLDLREYVNIWYMHGLNALIWLGFEGSIWYYAIVRLQFFFLNICLGLDNTHLDFFLDHLMWCNGLAVSLKPMSWGYTLNFLISIFQGLLFVVN